MLRLISNKIFKYSYIVLSLIVAILLCTHVVVSFVDAWFTDSGLRYDTSKKVAHVEIVILENTTVIGGEVEIDHKDPHDLKDDVYTFTPGTTPSYNTPAIGSSININLSVKNLGWAKGLVRIVGFELYYIENTNRGDQNENVIFTNQLQINYGSTDWVTQQVDDMFDDDEELKPIAYNLYLNRVIGGSTETDGSDQASVLATVTNLSLNPATYDKFYVRFVAEITVHESNAYDSNGSYPPFGPIESLPAEWTAWDNADYVEQFDPESGEVVIINPTHPTEPEDPEGGE